VGEAIFGSGRGNRPFLCYISVGTGISYCPVQNGQRLKVAKRQRDYDGEQPAEHSVVLTCGSKLRPVLEEFASGPAIANRFAQIKKNGIRGKL